MRCSVILIQKVCLQCFFRCDFGVKSERMEDGHLLGKPTYLQNEAISPKSTKDFDDEYTKEDYVTYLKDSKNQPSLNTMIRQGPQNETLKLDELQTSDVNVFDKNDMSTKGEIRRSSRNLNRNTCRKRDCSPEIVYNPLSSKRSRKIRSSAKNNVGEPFKLPHDVSSSKIICPAPQTDKTSMDLIHSCNEPYTASISRIPASPTECFPAIPSTSADCSNDMAKTNLNSSLAVPITVESTSANNSSDETNELSSLLPVPPSADTLPEFEDPHADALITHSALSTVSETARTLKETYLPASPTVQEFPKTLPQILVIPPDAAISLPVSPTILSPSTDNFALMSTENAAISPPVSPTVLSPSTENFTLRSTENWSLLSEKNSNYSKQSSVASLMSLSLECLKNNNILNVNGDIFQHKNQCNLSPVASTSAVLVHDSNTTNNNEDAEFLVDELYDSGEGDFSPDDSDPDYHPEDNIMPNDSHTSCESPDESNSTRKRAKRGQPDKENWVNIKNQIKRMRGEPYEGRRKTEDGKSIFDVARRERHIKDRCDHNEGCKYFECYKMTDDIRKNTFDKYWKLSWEAKKMWIQQTVFKRDTATRKCSPCSDVKRRAHTFKYNFTVSGNPIKVCKKMYLNTLDIGEWSVHNWTRTEEKPVSEKKKTSRNTSTMALEEIAKNNVKEFLDKLPKLPSHYCRKSTSKLYLEPIWQSKLGLYREYIRYLTENGKQNFKLSTTKFIALFDEMNLALFSPKKDQCDLCCAHTVGNVLEQDYNDHVVKKNAARAEKSHDEENPDPKVKVYTFDLQAVLLSPSLQASALYYKTKLKVHNFTIFDLKTTDAFCFIWHEAEGGVTADEFSSILHYFINKNIDDDTKQIILWSDGCTNQNRNAILANALLHAAVQKSVKITHKYLEKGHTQMECDSMHSTVERKLKHREIYTPAQYVDICRTARLKKPYIVEYLEHSFFRRFSSMPYLSSIRPGKRVGEATVFDLRCVEYREDGKIYVKNELADDFKELPRKIKMPSMADSMPQLYESRIPIPKSKYVHLQELKVVLPRDVHQFYDDLPHQCPDERRR